MNVLGYGGVLVRAGDVAAGISGHGFARSGGRPAIRERREPKIALGLTLREEDNSSSLLAGAAGLAGAVCVVLMPESTDRPPLLRWIRTVSPIEVNMNRIAA